MYSLITEKLRNALSLNPALSVLVLSGVVGLCLGLSNATWQDTVEAGQVLTGVVEYPADNPFYMFQVKVFTVVKYLGVLLLYITGSEKVVSIIISGLIGMASFGALGMFIFAINRSVQMSVLGVIFIYFTNYVGHGVIYPIDLLGTPGTHGVLGLSFIILVIALIGAKAYRSGLFCLGLAPCIHPSLGAWLFLIIFLSAFFNSSFAMQVIRKYCWYFIGGMFISILSLVYHMHLMRDLPVIESEIVERYFDSFARYWWSHGRPFYWGSGVPEDRSGILFCVYSVIAGCLGLKFIKKNGALSFLFSVIMVSGISSLLLGFITQVPPEKISSFLLMFMPGRYINLNNIVLAACLVGILTYRENKPFVTNYNIFAFFLISSFFAKHTEVQAGVFAVILFWLVYLALKKSPFVQGGPLLLTREHKVSYEKLLVFFMVIFMAINLPREHFVRSYLVSRYDFNDRTNNELYLRISEREGVMVTTEYAHLISLRTRRPILANMACPNNLTLVSESVEIFDNILRKVYGIDLLTPPPREYRYLEIPADLYRGLWEGRTVEEWQAIKEEFEVTDVLVRADWKLLLPIVAGNEEISLYEIPGR